MNLEKLAAAATEIQNEYLDACAQFPPFNSPHEGYAVILEELDELWDEVKAFKADGSYQDAMREEARQVAAMALRFMVELT